jgi:hypothetical protein
MKSRIWVPGAVLLGFFLSVFHREAQAFYIDQQKTLQFSAKVQTRATFRLQDWEGYTYARAEVGDLVQWRNLALIEINHDLGELTNTLDILWPLKKLEIESRYHIVGRFMYDALYNVGSDKFKFVRDQDPENIDNFKQAYDLWEAYADFFKGPVFVRIGRQNLAWGETDLFRLLDGINPLDNTFGGPFEDLDDRRIPLWMLRGTVDVGSVGPLSSLVLEGFWVPGTWDARVAPFAPVGTPYSAPLPEVFFPALRINTPAKEMASSRWGVRLQGMVGAYLNWSVGHYKSYLDQPALRAVVDQSKLMQVGNDKLLTSLDALLLEGSFPSVQVTGASMSFFESMTNTVFRGEVAWFWNEPVFIPEENLSTFWGPTVPLPPAVLDLAAEILGVDVRDLGLDGLPLNPQSGSIPKKDILRFMIGFDKQLWIRPLNQKSMFMLSMQYFGQWVSNYDDRMAQPAPISPDLLVFPGLKEYENSITAILNTNYMKGNLGPQLALAYDLRGAWLVQPQVNFIRGPFRFMVQYSAIMGNFTGFGLFRDRDQISFILTYLLS